MILRGGTIVRVTKRVDRKRRRSVYTRFDPVGPCRVFADPDQHVERRRVADQERPAAGAPYSRTYPTVLLGAAATAAVVPAATAAVSVGGATAAVLAAILAVVVVVVVRHPAVLQRVRERQPDTATARRPAAPGQAATAVVRPASLRRRLLTETSSPAKAVAMRGNDRIYYVRRKAENILYSWTNLLTIHTPPPQLARVYRTRREFFGRLKYNNSSPRQKYRGIFFFSVSNYRLPKRTVGLPISLFCLAYYRPYPCLPTVCH